MAGYTRLQNPIDFPEASCTQCIVNTKLHNASVINPIASGGLISMYSYSNVYRKLFQRESSTFSFRREEEEEDDEELTSLTSRKPRLEQPAVLLKILCPEIFNLI
jgi:hypothetical protein